MARLGRGQPNRPAVIRPLASGPPGGTGTIDVAFALTGTGTKHATGTGTLALDTALSGTGTKTASGSGTVDVAFDLSSTGEQDIPFSRPARPRLRWQLVAGPSSGGYDTSLTRAKGRRLGFKLTEADELAFSVDGRTLDAGALEELTTDVHALWTDVGGTTHILTRCRVGATSDDWEFGERHTTNITGLDYRAILATRRLYSNSQLVWTGVDQGEIAWGLVTQTQIRTAGDLGIAKGWVGTTPTGVTRDRTYEAGDSVGERVDELAELLGGFDWDITPVSASGLRMDVWYPQRGVDRGVVLIAGGLVAKLHREPNVKDYANAIRQTGASGLSAQELEAPDLAGRPEGRWDAVYGDDGLTTQAALNDRAAWQLEAAQVPPVTYTLTLRAGAWQGPEHIWLGDTVRLIVQSGRLNVDTTLRVFEIDITLGESGEETVDITIGGPKPDYRRRPTAFERRLRNLERR
ncbi:hypothetical protein ACQEU3_46725 [Spirillospora sp. CA-253888]